MDLSSYLVPEYDVEVLLGTLRRLLFSGGGGQWSGFGTIGTDVVVTAAGGQGHQTKQAVAAPGRGGSRSDIVPGGPESRSDIVPGGPERRWNVTDAPRGPTVVAPLSRHLPQSGFCFKLG